MQIQFTENVTESFIDVWLTTAACLLLTTLYYSLCEEVQPAMNGSSSFMKPTTVSHRQLPAASINV